MARDETAPAQGASTAATDSVRDNLRASDERTQGCEVAYCLLEAGHRELHDIPPCIKGCGPLGSGPGGVGRAHHADCPNARWKDVPCARCGMTVGWINCPTGGWWAHHDHPADGHDAVPVVHLLTTDPEVVMPDGT